MNMPSRGALALLALAAFGCPAQHSSIPRCVPGTEAACGCTTGSVGSQRCQPDGQYAACSCEAPTLDAGLPDAVDSIDAVTLGDARSNSPRCIAPEGESCDGHDNDCDGVIDNGHACPDDTVAFVEPFAGGIWFLGTTSEGCGACIVVQRFWPSLGGYRPLPSPYVDTFAFRASDGALHYATLTSGLHRAGMDEPSVPTPPCDATRSFGFDAMDRLYYVCGYTLTRDGTPLISDVAWVEAVLPSGRTVAVRGDPGAFRFTLIDVNGTELSELSLPDWSGTFEPLMRNATVQGERAWVMALRTLPDASTEFVVLRVDGNTRAWNVVRRLPMMAYTNFARIALPDGHVLMARQDAKTRYGAEYEFVDFPPDGPPRTIWREIDAFDVRLHGLLQFAGGPLE